MFAVFYGRRRYVSYTLNVAEMFTWRVYAMWYRLRLAMRQLQAVLPQSTQAEADMYHELDLMNKNIKELETRVCRVRVYFWKTGLY